MISNLTVDIKNLINKIVFIDFNNLVAQKINQNLH